MCRDHTKHHGQKEMTLGGYENPIPQIMEVFTHPAIKHITMDPVFFGNPEECLGLFMDIGLDIVDIIMGLVNLSAANLIHTTTDIPVKYAMIEDKATCGMAGPALKGFLDFFVPMLKEMMAYTVVAGVAYAEMMQKIQ